MLTVSHPSLNHTTKFQIDPLICRTQCMGPTNSVVDLKMRCVEDGFVSFFIGVGTG